MTRTKKIITVSSLVLAGVAIGASADTAQAQCYGGGYAGYYSYAPAPVVVVPPPAVYAAPPVYYAPRSYRSSGYVGYRSYGYHSRRHYGHRSYRSHHGHRGHHSRSFSFGFGYSRY